MNVEQCYLSYLRYHTYCTWDIILIVPEISYLSYLRYHTYRTWDIILIVPEISYLSYLRYHTYRTWDIILIVPEISYLSYLRYHTYRTWDIILIVPEMLTSSGFCLTEVELVQQAIERDKKQRLKVKGEATPVTLNHRHSRHLNRVLPSQTGQPNGVYIVKIYYPVCVHIVKTYQIVCTL